MEKLIHNIIKISKYIFYRIKNNPPELIVPGVIILLFASLSFIFGYSIGRADGITSASPVSPTDSPAPTQVIFGSAEITPFPPDTSSWNPFVGQMNYHTYTLLTPPDFSEDNPGTDPGSYSFTSKSGDKLSLSVANSYTPAKNPRYTIKAGLKEVYSSYTKNGKVYENASLDFLTENLNATYVGTTSTPFFLFRSIINTITFSTQAADYSNASRSMKVNGIYIEYPGIYIPDNLYGNIKNCNGDTENRLYFAYGNSTVSRIELDFNPCKDTKTEKIKKAESIKINSDDYAMVTYNDNSICLINPKDSFFKSAPISKWTSAPKQTSFKDKNVSLCILPNEELEPTVSDFETIIKSIQFE